MPETILISLVVLGVLCTFANLRAALVIAVLVDVIRDPIRKLTPEQPVYLTLLGASLWGWLLVLAFTAHRKDLSVLLSRWPGLRRAILLLATALILASIISLGFYNGSFTLVAIGGVSYGAPAAAIAAGYVIFSSADRMLFFFRTFVIINFVCILSGFLEYGGVQSPLFGGINFHWIRYQGNETLDLMSGIYRSPDILGFHAALVCIFSIVLYQHSRSNARRAWLLIAAVAVCVLVIAGRRKMMGVPIVFVASQVLLSARLRSRNLRHAAAVPLLFVSLAAGMLWLAFSSDESSSLYLGYAGSTVTEAADRVDRYLIGGSAGTIRSVGILGGGLGTGTQGRYYLDIKTTSATKGWQEDGVSKLFLELGVQGVVLVICAAFWLVRTFRTAIFCARWNHQSTNLRIGLAAIALGCFASYLVAHQHFTGDPSLAVICTMLLGGILASADHDLCSTVYSRTSQMQSFRPQPARAEPTQDSMKSRVHTLKSSSD